MLKIILSVFLIISMSNIAYGKEESNIVNDVHKNAEWVSKALNESGYKADFTINSLKEIDRFFDEQTQDGKPRANGILSTNLGSRLFAIGSYVGETIRLNKGGKWIGNDNDPEAEINVELQLSNGTKLWPIQRILKRFKNGQEDSIYAYGIAAIE